MRGLSRFLQLGQGMTLNRELTSEERTGRLLNGAAAKEATPYYDRIWKEQADGQGRDYTERYRVEFIVECLKAIAAKHRGRLDILDLGCGTGWMAPFLSPYGRVTGVYFSETGIDYARRHYAEHGRFVVADHESPTLGLMPTRGFLMDDQFDVVAASAVIEHTKDHGAFLSLVGDLLRTEGHLILTTPNGNVWADFEVEPAYKAGLQPIEHWLTTGELRKALTQAQFDIHRHLGSPVYGFRLGFSGMLQRRRIRHAMTLAGLRHIYGRLIRPTAVYQFVWAQRRSHGSHRSVRPPA